MRGSIFLPAMKIAIPCGLISTALKIGQKFGWFHMINDLNLLSTPAAWTSFSALLGFLVVFRTSQSYSRFWAGSSATHAMRMDWFNACSMLMAYCRVSKAPEDDIKDFLGRLIRLVSIMHASALSELEELNTDHEHAEDTTALKHDVLDPKGLDAKSLKSIGGSASRVELIFMWIQMLIVESVDRGIISPPPPVLSAVWGTLVRGMDSFNEALKISFTPFPFPYVQTCDMLLCLHWLMTPVVVLAWVDYITASGLLTALQVFIVQALNLIAVEIENPFGNDANDLASSEMQEEMNNCLTLFAKHDLLEIPRLNANAEDLFNLHLPAPQQPLLDAFHALNIELAVSDRKGRDFSKARIHDPQRSADSKLTPGPQHMRTLKSSSTKGVNGHGAVQLHQCLKPETQIQHMEAGSTSGPPSSLPPAASVLPPSATEWHRASSASHSQALAGVQPVPYEEDGQDVEQPEQPPHDAGHRSTGFRLARIGQTKSEVMCTPEEEELANINPAMPMSPARMAGAADPLAGSRHQTNRTGRITLGWDPPAPTGATPTNSGPCTSAGDRDNNACLVDFAAAGVTFRC